MSHKNLISLPQTFCFCQWLSISCLLTSLLRRCDRGLSEKKLFSTVYALARDVTSLNKILSSSSMSSMLSSYLGSIFSLLSDGKQKQDEKGNWSISEETIEGYSREKFMGNFWRKSFMLPTLVCYIYTIRFSIYIF